MPITVQSLAEWEEAGTKGMLSVVIPAHNEEGHIENTITALTEQLRQEAINHEVLVINDNSTDDTEEILRQLDNEKVRYLNNEPPNGFGYAVRLGLKAFLGDCVAIVMADGSDDP
ncbi:MAG: glycosyltransferase family 2 protein, partial [Pirellulales bacterium]|nr:glycosyltransferase family 2 protein [Pirellulales bacterium]